MEKKKLRVQAIANCLKTAVAFQARHRDVDVCLDHCPCSATSSAGRVGLPGHTTQATGEGTAAQQASGASAASKPKKIFSTLARVVPPALRWQARLFGASESVYAPGATLAGTPFWRLGTRLCTRRYVGRHAFLAPRNPSIHPGLRWQARLFGASEPVYTSCATLAGTPSWRLGTRL